MYICYISVCVCVWSAYTMANIAEAIFRNISKPLSIFACSYVEASSRQTKPATSSLCLYPSLPLVPGKSRNRSAKQTAAAAKINKV